MTDVHGSHSDWKMGEHFPVKKKSENFAKTGKSGNFTQNTGKIRLEIEKKMLEKSGKSVGQ